MKKLIMLLFLITLLLTERSYAQETFPRNDVKDDRSGTYAFTNATLFINAATKVEGGTLLVRDGKIEKSGKGLAVPAGYTVIDLKGKFIYPSFIDMNTSYGLPRVENPAGGGGFGGGAEQIQTKTKGPYNGNQAIKSEYNAISDFSIDSKTAEKFRAAGFGSVLTFRADGLARGTSAVVTVGEDRDNVTVLKDKAAAHYSFNRGTSRQSYPVSLMGFIALLRQTYLDAEWYSKQPKSFRDLSLEAWTASQSLPQIFEAGSWINDLRADKLGDEFGKQYIIRGGGDEYQRIAEIKATNAPLIIGVNFPDAYDVEDPFDADRTTLTEMKHWELAPTNPAALEKAGIEFAITSDRLKERTDLLKNVKKAIQYGLSETAALKALTETPAKLLGLQNKIGSLNNGLEANFIITSGNVFEDEAIIHENWVQGKRYNLKDLDSPDYAGKYNLSVNGKTYSMEVSGKPGSQKFKIKVTDSLSVDGKSKFDKNLITLSFNPVKKGDETVRLSGWRQGNSWIGKGQLVNGTWVDWKADLAGPLDKKDEKKDEKKTTKPDVGSVVYPFTAFGLKEKVKSEEILIKNATVWTNEKEGILQNTDVLLKDGKISAIGKNLSTTGRTIDGTGKHLTPGIIDEHSHIGAAAINDAAANSSMVRIGDVVDSEAISLYRTLSGGVVAVQILHGSANPIGGQSALVKLKWGSSPEELKIKGADPFIKFALGENVKRSGNTASIRFPQTRMGVEQVYVDAFTNAIEYEKKWKEYNALPAASKAKAIAPRRDLVDETILEIVRGKRFISCHSYVQSEINMMMNVANRFGFRINTFTHILEGYKVADKMKAHGVGASTFSDWWNYKWEVHYAIPYNAAIMNKEGVVTAINSDDADMGRRLNQEAAKTTRYGDVSEEDALKMVTLNPAKLLHLDNQMGSLKVGKSADVTLWTGHPLSVYSKADKTIIEGGIYFDLEKDQQLRKEVREERARLTAKMLNAKKEGASTQRPAGRAQTDFHCEDFVDLDAEQIAEQH
ncbi:MAG TPA: amidohydrolase family protein [Cyclobacteriaceae bacterium]|nr:amidohydrolase family protein [Cyclobacteriaceae bacterium]